MQMDDSWFPEWYHSTATSDDKKLHDRLYDLGDYFSDMLFEDESLMGKFIKCQYKADDNSWQDGSIARPEELECFSYAFFKTEVTDLNGMACFNSKEQLISIAPQYLNDDNVILHEMIHLHEYVLNELPLFYRDSLLWALYDTLRNQVKDLDNAISSHIHILNEQAIQSRGGTHDLLFLLKSFELDIKRSNPPGTVFGYDAED